VVWSLLRTLGDLLAAPVLWLPSAGGLLLLAAATGLLLLLAFRWLTPQRALSRAHDAMSAALYEMRLFSAMPRRVLATQGRAVLHTLRYLGLAAPSLLVLAPLLALVVTRASLPLERRPLHPGERAVVELTLSHAVPVRVSAGRGLQVLPPTLHLDHGRRVLLQVRGAKRGVHTLELALGSARLTKRVLVGAVGTPSPVRARADSPWLLLGTEPPLPDGPLIRVELDYPVQTFTWLGLPWWLHLLLWSMLTALLLRRRLGVVL